MGWFVSTGAARGFLLAAALAFPASASAAAPGLARIHTIALAPIAEPETYGIVSSAANFGQYDSRTFVPSAGAPRSFADAMAERNLHLGAELFARLQQVMMRAGVLVLAPGAANAEATLEIAFTPATALYTDAVLGDDLMPSFSVTFRLIDTRTKQALVNERITYGESDTSAPHMFYPDARFRFTSPDALIADPASAAEGLRAGIPVVAGEIVRVLAQ